MQHVTGTTQARPTVRRRAPPAAALPPAACCAEARA
ncbi:hypothetical protein GEM_5153 [Burkholderia cepacia GG4]|uniref:Uncharacterized protein n=1 Tax=Burkholderia cepacia GG4 TaxID=1009846 RepID=A0A9W3K5N1_BURCE|nr:hypothetical protein GEM_5153 [Burkholderia cepacia GG4]